MINNKARHNLIDAKCRWARWRCEFLETTWSNKSDANPPWGGAKKQGRSPMKFVV